VKNYGFLGNNEEGSVGYDMGNYFASGDDDDYQGELIGEEDDDFLEALATAGGGEGWSDPELVGLAKKRRSGAAAALKQQILARNAGMVINRPINRRRRYPSGFTAVTLLTLASGQSPSAPQNMFRIERFVAPSEVSSDATIDDIKVGNQSQLVQSLPLPATMFSEVAIDTNVWFDTSQIGNQVSVSLTNISLATQTFRFGMIGSVAKA
jgi:hypothetical protein